MLHFKTLGATTVIRDGSVPVDIAGRQAKRLALLGYLAVARPRGGHRRDTLMALLWPDLDQANARAALRQALHGIRKSLGADLIQSNGTETIEVNQAAITCDAWAFETHSQHKEHDCALALYQGDLLNGLFVHEAPVFEQWLDGERQRLRDIAQQCAWSSAQEWANGNSPTECARMVRCAMSFTPLDESALRAGVRLLGRVGQRADALALYKDFESALGRELEITPSDETRAVLTALSVANTPMCDATTTIGSVSTNKQSVLESVPAASTSAALTSIKTMQPKRRWRAVAAVVATTLAFGAAAQLSPSNHSSIDARRVVVEPFVNESALRLLDTIALTISRAVRDSIGTIDGVALDASYADTVRTPGSANDNSHVARAGTVVRGTMRMIGDSVEFRAVVVDVASNQIVRTERRVFDSTKNTLPLSLENSADAVAAAVAASVYPGWGRAISQPPSLSAYSAFVGGLRDIQREQHESAAHSLRRAYSLDSTFAIAGIVAAIEFYQLKQFHVADTLAKAVANSSPVLAPVDQQLLHWLTSSLQGDRITARAAMSEVTTLAPSAELAWLQLAIDNVETDRPREALAALAHIEHANPNVSGWVSYWTTKLEALHLARDHTSELRTAREALALHPEFRVLAGYELRALAALGRTDEIDRRLVSGPQVLATNANDGASVFRQVALEMAAHGYKAESQQLLGALLSWYDQARDSVQSTTAARFGRARTLYLLGENQRALSLYDSLFARNKLCVDCVGVRGVLEARLGNINRALQASDQLSHMSEPFLFARHSLWRARIAGALGDSARASQLLTSAFAEGSEFDVLTHADPDLSRVGTDQLYRQYSFATIDHN